MAKLTREAVLAALSTVQDPDLHKDLVALGMIQDLEVGDDGAVTGRIVLTTPACPMKERIQREATEAVAAVDGVSQINFTMDAVVAKPTTPQGDRLPGVKNIIGVGAGKGGVGKSTVSVNLAVALARTGAAVGLLDADIYGPSVPMMLGVASARPAVDEDRKLIPIEAHGIRFMSMGLLVPADEAVVWRGPMIGRAVQQFVEDVAWGDLDYLIVDLPPGTGDVVLSLSQAIPMSGAVVVATPQDVAFADVTRAVRMFGMLKIDILGLVENMAWFHCPDNGKDYPIFGQSRAPDHCAAMGVELLCRLPIDLAVSPAADSGRPIAVDAPDSEQTKLYADLAGAVASRQEILNHKRAKRSELKDFFRVVPS